MIDDPQRSPRDKPAFPEQFQKLQKRFLAIVLRDPLFFAENQAALRPENFSDIHCKNAMEHVEKFFEKYGRAPSFDEISIALYGEIRRLSGKEMKKAQK